MRRTPFKVVELAIYAGGFIVGGVIWYLYELAADNRTATSVGTQSVEIEREVVPDGYDVSALIGIRAAFSRYANMSHVTNIADVDDIAALALEPTLKRILNTFGSTRTVTRGYRDHRVQHAVELIEYPYFAFFSVQGSRADRLQDYFENAPYDFRYWYEDSYYFDYEGYGLNPIRVDGFSTDFTATRTASWLHGELSRWWQHPHLALNQVYPWVDTPFRFGTLNAWWYDYSDRWVYVTRTHHQPLWDHYEYMQGQSDFVGLIGGRNLPTDIWTAPRFLSTGAPADEWRPQPATFMFMGDPSAMVTHAHTLRNVATGQTWPYYTIYPANIFWLAAVPVTFEYQLNYRDYACQLLGGNQPCPLAWMGPAFLRVEAVVPVQVTLSHVGWSDFAPGVMFGDGSHTITPHNFGVYEVTAIEGRETAVYVEMMMPARVVAQADQAAPIYNLWTGTFIVRDSRTMTAYARALEEYWRAVWLDRVYGVQAPGITIPAPVEGVMPWDEVGAPDVGFAAREVDGAPVLWVVRPLQALQEAFTPTVGLGERLSTFWAHLQTRFPFSVAASLSMPGTLDTGTLAIPDITYAGMRISVDQNWLSVLAHGIRVAATVLLVAGVVLWIRGKLTPRTVI